MNSRLTYAGRGVRGVLLALVLGAASTLPACISVDEAECERDSDCDDDEFCNEDNECKNSCRALCSGSARCSSTPVDVDECEGSCELVAENSDSSCESAIADIASCFDDNSSCTALSENCEDDFAVFTNACGLGTCSYTNDGVCDEPNLCPVGTDTEDCGSGTCAWVNDGICDEPTVCPVGTDTVDCSTCAWVNDGVCDEPTVCPVGTDTSDCQGN
jgi:hypothetical protein